LGEVTSLDSYLDSLLSRGRAHFSREEARKALGQSPAAFTAAARRLIKKGRLASPRNGFYLIVRPEDQVMGAPDPARWIEPLMRYLAIDYRVSLLRAAAFHGSSHQAAMVFQVVVPKQLRSFDIGRHKIQFVYQTPKAFVKTNQTDWLGQIKTDAGFAKIAGIELTLLDSIRYFHKAAGINGAAQIIHDIGQQANPRKLDKAAAAYENSAVRRLGYLLDYFDHKRQANALISYVKKAKSMKPLDPSIRPVVEDLIEPGESNSKWMLTVNEPVEIDF
jgi:predicted transcriptional regulator of viral defense system